MKFERFVKKVMPHGVTLTVDGGKWLSSGRVFVKIPEWCGPMGVESKENNLLDDFINESGWGDDPAELKEAFLPSPDSKAKDIIRVFSDGVNSVNITNEQFALIEKHDMCLIASMKIEGKFTTALLIGKYADIDDFEPDAIIVNYEL